VGASVSTNGTEAFRWTSAGGMVGLGDLAGGTFSSAAFAVSGNGALIVGSGTSAAGQRATVWHTATGMQDLNTVLTGYGVNMRGWQALTTAYGISSTAIAVIVGEGVNADGFTQGFVATLPVGHPTPATASDAVAILLNNGSATFAAPTLITV